MAQTDFKGACEFLRDDIKAVAQKVWDFKRAAKDNPPSEDDSESQNHGEMMANVMLAYRHLEDARMRIGKVIQAYDGGRSVYDKK